jgi:hypothetical protein
MYGDNLARRRDEPLGTGSNYLSSIEPKNAMQRAL